jgi:aspartyl-tRNA(Asn)/glutamyl-tRNA(Gln) amidotransferase subunit B
MIERIRATLPELPGAMRARLVRDYGLSEYDAATLTASRVLAQYFERVAAGVADRKAAANWVMGEVSAALNAEGLPIEACPVPAAELATLVNRIGDGTINGKTAKDLFGVLWRREAASVDAVIQARGLKQISDSGALEHIVDEVLAAHAGVVAEFRSGKEKAFQALVGQAMKATKGKANPQQLNEILRRKLG